MTLFKPNVAFLDFSAKGLPDVAARLCEASVALPDRRPFCASRLPQFQGGDWRIGDIALKDVLRQDGDTTHIGFVQSPDQAAQSPRPLAALAEWRSRSAALQGLKAKGLCLISHQRAQSDPQSVLDAVRGLTGQAPGLAVLPMVPLPPDDRLLQAFAGLAMHQKTQNTQFFEGLTGVIPTPIPDVEIDALAQDAFATAADLRQRLAEYEVRLIEANQDQSEMMCLLNARIATLHQLSETQEVEVQALRAEKDALQAKLGDFLCSRSWRLTAPLRRLRGGR
jgi:hypothetical protein